LKKCGIILNAKDWKQFNLHKKGGEKTMKKFMLFILILITAMSLVLLNCTKKEREHNNPYDPLNPGGSSGDNGGGNGGNGGNGHEGIIHFDRPTYTGTNTAMITLIDEDLTNSTCDISVISDSDKTGIVLTLTNVGGEYKGNLGFTTNASVPNKKIKVKHNNTITAEYYDKSHSTWRTANANWKMFLGLYTETYETPKWDSEIQLLNWNTSCLKTEDITSSSAPEGSIYQRGEVTNDSETWWGWGIAAINGIDNPTFHNRSEWEGGRLHLTIMASNNPGIRVGIKDKIAHWVNLSNYGFDADGNWYTISIPFSDFGSVNFSHISNYFMMDYGGYSLTNGQVYYLDHIYWSNP